MFDVDGAASSRQPLDSLWTGSRQPLDGLHVVGGVEAHSTVLPSLAPALLVLILQLLKLVSCNMNDVMIMTE